ncbi:Uncharacterised protein [Citrobacter koseri]|uniref:Uncharacterized protein n=1 Tax=Citrobacter koseri TaxID=545 RepID=A0A2X2WPX9_CITKO|nr:Uncharacterised protein [Citrobacter koseri]
MKLESLPKYFSPKSMMPGAVPCGISADTLTITDVMASLGYFPQKQRWVLNCIWQKPGFYLQTISLPTSRNWQSSAQNGMDRCEKWTRGSDQNFSVFWCGMFSAIIPSVLQAW